MSILAVTKSEMGIMTVQHGATSSLSFQTNAPLCHDCDSALCNKYCSQSPRRVQSRTFTPTQGIRNCRFSITLRSTSNPFSFTPVMNVPPVLLFFALSSAALASDPPVPFSAEIAKFAVSLSSSVTVELPLSSELAASVSLVVEGCHRGSNQFAWKSKREKTSTKRRIEQYAQGLWRK